VTPRDVLTVAESEALDLAVVALQKLARASGVYIVELSVRTDGRVEIAGAHNGRVTWRQRADVHPDSSDQMPSAAICDAIESWKERV